MGKIAAAIARRYGWKIQPFFFQRGGFKGFHVFNGLMNAVPVHIQQRGAQQFRHVITLIKLGRIEHFFPQRIRHRLAGLIMAGKVRKHLRMAGPVFIDLRREFNEITRRVGA